MIRAKRDDLLTTLRAARRFIAEQRTIDRRSFAPIAETTDDYERNLLKREDRLVAKLDTAIAASSGIRTRNKG